MSLKDALSFSGELHKYSRSASIFKNWQVRKCVLDGEKLTYYNNSTKKGEINLKNCCIYTTSRCLHEGQLLVAPSSSTTARHQISKLSLDSALPSNEFWILFVPPSGDPMLTYTTSAQDFHIWSAKLIAASSLHRPITAEELLSVFTRPATDPLPQLLLTVARYSSVKQEPFNQLYTRAGKHVLSTLLAEDRLDLVELVVKKLKLVNVYEYMKKEQNQTVLHLVCGLPQKDDRLVKLLIEFAKSQRAETLSSSSNSNSVQYIPHASDTDAKTRVSSFVNELNGKHMTPLMVAAEAGNASILPLLLQTGAHVNTARVHTGETALMLACKSGSLECVQALLDVNAFYGIRDHVGRIARDYCFMKMDMDVALETAGELSAYICAKTDEIDAIIAQFSSTAHKDELQLLQEYLQGGKVCACTTLHPTGPVSLLLQDPDLPSYNTGATMLISAIRHNCYDACVLLLEAGADCVYSRDLQDITVWMSACQDSTLEILQLLVRFMKPSQIAPVISQHTRKDFTSLMFLCSHGDSATMLPWFHQMFVKYVHITPSSPSSSGHSRNASIGSMGGGAVGDTDEDARLIWFQYAMVPERRNCSNAFYRACLNSVTVAATLLETIPTSHRHLMVNTPFLRHFTPLAYAANTGAIDLMKFLLAAGAELHPSLSTDTEENPFMQYTIPDAHTDMFLPLNAALNPESTEALQLLLDTGANVNEAGMDEMTAVMLACRYGRNEHLRILLQSGADISAHSRKKGKTALMYAADEGLTDTVSLLLEWVHSVDVLRYQSTNGYTAEGYASSRGHTDIVQLLQAKERALLASE